MKNNNSIFKIISLLVALYSTNTIYAQEAKIDSDSINVISIMGDSIRIPCKPVIKPVDSCNALTSPLVVDTLPTDNEALSIVLYNDNTWRYITNHTIERDSTIYGNHWNTSKIAAYEDVALSSIPRSVAISIVDSLHHYHYPHRGRITSRYGVRWHRNHNGIDIALNVGDTIYATFDGRVRFAKSTSTGYGGLVILRHDNGLETYHGHLSKILVEENERVSAGQPIALGGNSGFSTGPHLHFECRYLGQSFDPERLIDFTSGALRRENFLLKRTFFDIFSKFNQDFEDEVAYQNEEKRMAAEMAARRYYTVRRGDTLSAIAARNHTTVARICALNGISAKSVLQIGKKLRVK